MDSVYETLKKIPHLTVYKKSEIPKEFHLKNNVRVGDLFIETDLGYALFEDKNKINFTLSINDQFYNY